MPLQILQDNIIGVKCDALVNPTNKKLKAGGGLDELVHYLAGEELDKVCAIIGEIELGQAVITPAFNLDCNFIIHTVGPTWQGGLYKEEETLISCYKECLKLAEGCKCNSVAFPLISSGRYGYPKDKVLKVAVDTIKEFLQSSELMVYLVVHNKDAYEINEQLDKGLTDFIIDTFKKPKLISRPSTEERKGVFECPAPKEMERLIKSKTKKEVPLQAVDCYFEEEGLSFQESYNAIGTSVNKEIEFPPSYYKTQPLPTFKEEDNLKRFMYKGFALTLFELIDKKGLKDVECYKRANVSRQTWYKIVNDRNYTPNKNTIISFAIALQLDIMDTQKLLATAGFILSKSSLFDVIIMYCIVNKIYDVFDIDSILFKYEQPTLFSKE
ncbi:MAG: macro domain-containing protein [Clostridia bacterium]|nr:macro domain-containing protein [Clostridia bacterium]